MLEKVLRAILPHKDIGWKEIGETFIRYTLLKTPWFRIYLHQLNAPDWHPDCHDHPWSFVTFLLWGGYWEWANNEMKWRGPGSILYRPAEFAHNVVTTTTAWSIIVTGPKKRAWGFVPCGSPQEKTV